MKKKNITFAIIGLIAGSLLSSCESKQEKEDDAKEEVVEAKQELRDDQMDIKNENYQDYLQFKADADEKIKQNDIKIEELRDKKHSTNGHDAEYQQKIEDLKARNHVLKEKIDNYKDGDKDKWAEFKREFSHDMDELGKAFTDLGKNNVK
jgi:FtsZ-binding cell division protein ZapB